jgi:transcriptional regulator with XRE-family HTH domain
MYYVNPKITCSRTFGGLTKNGGAIVVTLYERLNFLCKERGIKGAQMCRDLGMSKSLMTDLKSGRKKGVNAETAQKIASYFDVTVGYLLGEEEKEKPTTPEGDGLSIDMQELVERIKTLPEDKVQLLLQLAKSIE